MLGTAREPANARVLGEYGVEITPTQNSKTAGGHRALMSLPAFGAADATRRAVYHWLSRNPISHGQRETIFHCRVRRGTTRGRGHREWHLTVRYQPDGQGTALDRIRVDGEA